MARRKRGIPVHGWLAVDKPQGITSSHVVSKLRRILNAQKAGHGGTLDPLATGVLPIAFGEATKTVAYVMDGVKSYRFTLRFGEERTTDDAEGEIIARSDKRPTIDQIEQALPGFIGDIDQIPPKFSAIKVNGQRAYDLARRDEAVDLAPRKIRIHGFNFVEMLDQDHAVFDVTSGKGAYMRSLARDLARAVGSVGHVATLRRTAAGPFSQQAAIPLDSLEELSPDQAQNYLLPVETALDDIPALALTEPEARRLTSGQTVALLAVARRARLEAVPTETIICAMLNDRAIALAEIKGAEIRPVRVFNL